jgi:hypothetical protein
VHSVTSVEGNNNCIISSTSVFVIQYIKKNTLEYTTPTHGVFYFIIFLVCVLTSYGTHTHNENARYARNGNGNKIKR